MLTRRTLLGGAAAAALTALPPRALAAGPRRPRLVVLLLRGGVDGLHLAAPLGDPDLRRLRGPWLDAYADAARLDDTFALHPALAPLAPRWAAGEVLVAHAVGTPYRARSHFEAQDMLEGGHPRPYASDDGWLGRALAPTGLSALAVGRTLPKVLRGAPRASAVDPLAVGLTRPELHERLMSLYQDDPVLAAAFARGQDARAQAGATVADPDPTRALRSAGEIVARLMTAVAGPDVVVLDVPGWDTHARQQGALAARFGALAAALDALATGLGPVWDDTAALCLTEFGRAATINGTQGTDHGTASAALLLGGAVAGGRVLADWPGLAAADLVDGRDLRPTTDLRGLLAGLLRDHLAVPAAHLDAVVFPDSGVAPIGGLVRART